MYVETNTHVERERERKCKSILSPSPSFALSGDLFDSYCLFCLRGAEPASAHMFYYLWCCTDFVGNVLIAMFSTWRQVLRVRFVCFWIMLFSSFRILLISLCFHFLVAHFCFKDMDMCCGSSTENFGQRLHSNAHQCPEKRTINRSRLFGTRWRRKGWDTPNWWRRT